MANRSPMKILTRAASINELKEAEIRGVRNIAFSDEYAEVPNPPEDQEIGLFMVENPQFNKKQDKAFMTEVRTANF